MIEPITEYVDKLTDLNNSIMMYIPSLVGLASFLASIFPKPQAGTIRARVHKFINVLALNVKHAQNKE